MDVQNLKIAYSKIFQIATPNVHVMNYEILEPFGISRARGVLDVCNWEAETEDTAPI